MLRGTKKKLKILFFVLVTILILFIIDRGGSVINEREKKSDEIVNLESYTHNGVIDSTTIQNAIDNTPKGKTLVFPKGDYVFSNIKITKDITIDLQGSFVTGAFANQSIFNVQGSLDDAKSKLTRNAVRGDKKIYLSNVSSNLSAGDLILLKDDTVRYGDHNPDMNCEVHEIISVNQKEKSITLKDFVRLPKKMSTTVNLTKIHYVPNVKIKNATLNIKSGSTSAGAGVYVLYGKNVQISNIKVNGNIQPSVAFVSSYDCSCDNFEFQNPQSTEKGMGYGVQGFKGTNILKISTGIGRNMRHVVDCGGCFDVTVNNVTAYDSSSAAFVISHNGFDSDITMNGCKAWGSNSYGFQVSAQGVKNNFSIGLYNIKVLNSFVQLNSDSSQYVYGIKIGAPIKNSIIRNFKSIYGDGKGFEKNNYAAVALLPTDNDLTIENLQADGFKYAIYAHNPSLVMQTDPMAKLTIKGVTAKNVYTIVGNFNGINNRMEVDGVFAEGLKGELFLTNSERNFKEIKLKNITVKDQISNKTLFPSVSASIYRN